MPWKANSQKKCSFKNSLIGPSPILNCSSQSGKSECKTYKRTYILCVTKLNSARKNCFSAQPTHSLSNCLMIKWAMLMQQMIQEARKEELKAQIFKNSYLFHIIKIKPTLYASFRERFWKTIQCSNTKTSLNSVSYTDDETQDPHSLAKCLKTHNFSTTFEMCCWKYLNSLQDLHHVLITVL